MSKLFQKFLASFLLISLMVGPLVAYAASYTSEFSFKTSFVGTTRAFNGTNISISATATTNGVKSEFSTYSVTLYRKNLLSSERIGTVNMSMNGTSTRTWTNVGSGKYYFYFSKGTDGVTVSSKNVKMYN